MGVLVRADFVRRRVIKVVYDNPEEVWIRQMVRYHEESQELFAARERCGIAHPRVIRGGKMIWAFVASIAVICTGIF